jgi:hypothetical protein
MDILEKIAERKIKKAIERGEFKSSLYKGKTIEIEDLSHIPEELRLGYKILKNAGILPEEMELKKEVVNLQRLIDCCNDESEKDKLRKKLNKETLRFELLMEKRKGVISPHYKAKIYERFSKL